MSALIVFIQKAGHRYALWRNRRDYYREIRQPESGRSGTDVYGRYCRVDGCFYL